MTEQFKAQCSQARSFSLFGKQVDPVLSKTKWDGIERKEASAIVTVD